MNKVMELINGLRKADPRKSGSEPALSLHKAYFKGGTGKHLALLLGLHIQCSFPLFVTLHCWSETHRGSGSNTTKGRGRWKNWRSRADRDDPPAPTNHQWPVSSVLLPSARRPGHLLEFLSWRGGSPLVRLRAYVMPAGGCAPVSHGCAQSPRPGAGLPLSASPVSRPTTMEGVRDHRPHAGGVRVGRRRPPQPPSFPGEEQRIAQASGSGGGGGRKDERRKRDLNERR